MPSLLCVHPHPDDETIACGGVLARYADQGHRVMVVTCTGGEEGENLAGIDLGGVDMTSVRRREMRAALGILGVDDHVWLGYRDSGMADTAANDHPDSFHRADLDAAGARLAAVMRDWRPDVVVSDDDRGSYGHPDHVKAHAVTDRAIQLAADPDHGDGTPWRVAKRYVHAMPKSRMIEFHRRLIEQGLESPFGDDEAVGSDDLDFGVPDAMITTAVDVSAWIDRKRAAMRAHASQIGEESFFLNLPDEVAYEVFGTEFFVLESFAPPDGDTNAGDAPDTGNHESDLFANLDETAV